MTAKVLIVDDEPVQRRLLEAAVSRMGYACQTVENGAQALSAFEAPGGGDISVVVLDLMMPEMDGISTTESIRIRKNEVPILILSAKNTSYDRVLGLKKGADDYLTKPFNLEELLLRVEKLIQKNKKIHDKDSIGDTYKFGKNSIDFKAQEATNFKGEKIQLSKKENMLLQLLIENQNEVVTREKILQQVWGYNVYPTTRTIDNFILNFRKYFEVDSRNPVYFHSARGVGYRFVNEA